MRGNSHFNDTSPHDWCQLVCLLKHGSESKDLVVGVPKVWQGAPMPDNDCLQ